jgi:endo-1,4-beta-xylanase
MKSHKRKLKIKYLIVFFLIILVISVSCSRNTKNPSLKDAYKDCFLIGTALNSYQISGIDTKGLVIFKEQFNAVTSEDYMKWEKIHPLPGEYDFTMADKFVDLAEENNMYIIGHVLVWHSQTPQWVFQDESGDTTDRETLLKRMHDHIKTVVGRYKGRVHAWDVVNEPIGDNGKIRENIWYKIVGEDYVQKAFEYARETDPDTRLIYNDYSIASKHKRDAVIKLINDLKSKGVKVDEVGMQGHYTLDYPGLKDLEESIIAFHEAGCDVAITELDLDMLPWPRLDMGADVRQREEMREELNPYPDGLPEEMQKKHTERYVDFFKIFLKHKDKISRVTLWGIHDNQSWKNNWPIPGRTNYCLLYDRNYNPKPAVDALIELVEN